MNYPAAHIERITKLGYTDVEARFLYVVATHSGYFTMRQFNSFAGVSPGKNSMAFTWKLLKHGHATARDYMGAGYVVHLFSRLLYGPIDKDNVRNRRRHSFGYIRTRLVQLDFLLENSDRHFLETETEKISFFCESLAVPKEVLPAKVQDDRAGSHTTVHYFVDKFPLFLEPGTPGAAPVVTFGYVDSGGRSVSSFVAHLAAYEGLFRHLNSFRLLYIAPRPTSFSRAEARFRSHVKQPLESEESSELLRYFEIRRKWENHKYVVPVAADFEFLNQARRRFQSEPFESLYAAWIAGTISESDLRVEFSRLTPRRTVFFGTYLVGSGRAPIDERIRKRVNGV